MNSSKKIFSLLFLLAFCLFGYAQDVRLVKTKVADVLALLPAADNEQGGRLFQELLALGDEGLAMVADQVLPNGKAEGVSSRFAVSLLTHYATTAEQKEKIERTYLAALAKSSNAEVSAYFLDNLKVIGSNVAIKPVAALLTDKNLSDQAVAVLVSIGTADARQALVSALNNPSPVPEERLIKALGELKVQAALPEITKAAGSSLLNVKKQALFALALIGDPGSADVLKQNALAVGFKPDPTNAAIALEEYLHQLFFKGNTALVTQVSQFVLDNTPDATQQHFRLAALEMQANANPATAAKILIKERSRFDAEYRMEVLKIAAQVTHQPADVKIWEKELKKAQADDQADLLWMLSNANTDESFVTTRLVPALSNTNQKVRMTAAAEIGRRHDKKFAPALVEYLLQKTTTTDEEFSAAKAAIVQLIEKDNIEVMATRIDAASPKAKVVLLQLLAERRATKYFETVSRLTSSADQTVRAAAFSALPSVSSPENIPALLMMLTATQQDAEVKALQQAIIQSSNTTTASLINAAYPELKSKLVPVLPYVDDKSSLDKVLDVLKNGSALEKEIAFNALQHWQSNDAVRPLLAIRRDPNLAAYHAKALTAALSTVGKSTWPDDEKLLMLREIMTLAADKQERTAVLRAAGNVRTFLSFVFVGEYINDADLGSAASRSAMQLALPTGDARPGLTGAVVREALNKMLDKLTGDDSQYERIDIETYLAKLPYIKGYESIFNGKDLTGWQGLVENPIARAKMTKEELAKKQVEANAKISQNWSVKDGMITFVGDGANLTTVRPYGDFEMIVDWRISKNGDSGIYLRGSPQIQIWDISRTDVGAQVGSGGLYNNQKEPSKPLVLADNPVGEWNTFRIKMIGDKVTVYLNGILVVDNVVMENYWDRKLPIFSEEAIELQAHGTELSFRNLFVKDLDNKPYQLTAEEKILGFESLFNGKNLDQWTGNKTDYVVEDNTIAIYPTKESHGNLNTEKEYSDFVFRFEFQLTPGANNGLGIHAPLEGDVAYVGKEIQILDDTAPVYSKLEIWQYHGSVYGIIPAKKGALKPVGEWNMEQVEVNGDHIKVTLNGTVIVDGDIKKSTKNGTLDHKDHPGILRHSGHIAFLGHGSVVKFRNIRIKDLAKK